MNKPLLVDSNIYPSDNVIEECLKDNYSLYVLFIKKLKEKFPSAVLVWNYYNDGKHWLWKATIKKKIFFWLSVWDGFFKVTMFFNEKTIVGLDKELIEAADKEKNVGKLIPIIYSVNNTDKLTSVIKILGHRFTIL